MSNTINWGKIQGLSYSPETNLTGTAAAPSFTNTKSIALDGVDDFVDVGRVTSLESTSNFSLSVWVKPTDISKGFICGRYVAGTFIYLIINSAGNLSFSVTSGATAQITTTSAVSLNTWINVCAVFNGSLSASDRLKIYINGVLQSVTDLNPPPTNTGSAGVGNWSYGKVTGLSNSFAGGLDELAIYNYSLTISQAVLIYNLGNPKDLKNTTGLTEPLHWWRCGDGDTSPTLTDNGSGGNNGTMTNFTTFSTDVPT